MKKFIKTLGRYIKRIIRISVATGLSYLAVSLVCYLLSLLGPGWPLVVLMNIAKVAVPLLAGFWALCTQFYDEAVEDGELEEILNTPITILGHTIFPARPTVAEELSCVPNRISHDTHDSPIDDSSDDRPYFEVSLSVDEILTKVVGVSFNNSDGTYRQSILSRCREGDAVELSFFRYKGDPAYAVYTRHGQIGNLSADLAQSIYDLPDDYEVSGEITRITGGGPEQYLGCNLRLTVNSITKTYINK